MAIYTKQGDKGKTSLYKPQSAQQVRISKDSLIIRAIGAVDEANSFLGIIISESPDKNLKQLLQNTQENLFTIGSILAGSNLIFVTSETKRLEKVIDDIEDHLPPLNNFILPDGNPTGAKLQYARTLVRRAERELVALQKEKELPGEILQYINRLSDALFMLAREADDKAGLTEKKWRGRK